MLSSTSIVAGNPLPYVKCFNVKTYGFSPSLYIYYGEYGSVWHYDSL